MKNKILSIFLCLVVMFSVFGGFTITANAETSTTEKTEYIYTYYHPTGYNNVHFLTNNNTEKFLIFTADNVKLSVVSSYYITATNEATGTEADFYYINLGNTANFWDACETLADQSKVAQAINIGVGGRLGRLMGTKRWEIGGTGNVSVWNFVSKYYVIGKQDVSDNAYDYYNHPFNLYDNADYILFKRPTDTKYILMYRAKDTNNKYLGGNDAFYLNSYTNGTDTLYYDNNTYWAEFETIEDAYDYLFDDVEISQHTKIKLTEKERPANSTTLSGSAAHYLTGFTEDTEIINNTLNVVDYTKVGTEFASVVKLKNPASYTEWYNQKHGITQGAVGDRYAIFRVETGELAGYETTYPTDHAGYTYVLATTYSRDGFMLSDGWRNIIGLGYNGYYKAGLDVYMDREINIKDMFNGDYSGLHKYYFNNQEDAVKFWLYGTDAEKGASPQLESHQGDYIPNISSILFCNFELDGFYKPIPEHNFDNRESYVIVKQHDTTNYFKIKYDYFMYGAIIVKEKNGGYTLNFSQTQNIEVYEGWFNSDGEILAEEDENMQTGGWWKVSKDDAKHNKNSWTLYYDGISDSKNTYEVIYTTRDIYFAEYGEDGLHITTDPAIKIFKDTDGNQFIQNLIDNTVHEEKNPFNTYKYNEEEDKYIDKNGNVIDLNHLEDVTGDYDDKLDLEQEPNEFPQIMEKLILYLNQFAKDTKQFTGFVSHAMSMIPYEFLLFIFIGVVVLIITRFTKKGG